MNSFQIDIETTSRVPPSQITVLGWGIGVGLILFAIWLNWERGYIKKIYDYIKAKEQRKYIAVFLGIIVFVCVFSEVFILNEEKARQWVSAAGIPIVTLIVGFLLNIKLAIREARRIENQKRRELVQKYFSDMKDLLIEKNLQNLHHDNIITQFASNNTYITLIELMKVDSNLLEEIEEDKNRIFRFLTKQKLLQGENPALFKGQDLSEIHNLKGAFLEGANLEGAMLREVDFTGADLTGAILNKANLQQANLTSASLIDAHLIEADLTECTATNTKLIEANLTQTKLINANLTEANLENAHLAYSNLRGARLIEANLCGTNLREAILCDKTDFTNAKYNDNTQFPYASLNPDQKGMRKSN